MATERLLAAIGGAEGLMRSHYSVRYVRSTNPGALVCGMMTSEDSARPVETIDDRFITRNLIRGLDSPEDSFYLAAYGTKSDDTDASALKSTCTTWRGEDGSRRPCQGR